MNFIQGVREQPEGRFLANGTLKAIMCWFDFEWTNNTGKLQKFGSFRNMGFTQKLLSLLSNQIEQMLLVSARQPGRR